MISTVVTAVAAILATFACSVDAYGKCGEPIAEVTTGATPCTFCPKPTCTNTEVGVIPWSCQSLSTTTFTVPAAGCQSFGPCNTLSCATVFETWSQPLPTTVTKSVSVPSGSCYTGWVTEATGTNCPPCSTPYCLEILTATQACGCGNELVSTTTVNCITSCGCPFVTTSLSDRPCPTQTTTGIID